jgi:hypothetical protein
MTCIPVNCQRRSQGQPQGHVGAGPPAFFERAVQISSPDMFLGGVLPARPNLLSPKSSAYSLTPRVA